WPLTTPHIHKMPPQSRSSRASNVVGRGALVISEDSPSLTKTTIGRRAGNRQLPAPRSRGQLVEVVHRENVRQLVLNPVRQIPGLLAVVTLLEPPSRARCQAERLCRQPEDFQHK